MATRSERQYRGQGIEFPAPPSTTQFRGSETPFSKKYVRIPVQVLRSEIIPLAADLTAQQLLNLDLPKGQRAARRNQLLKQTIIQLINDYRKSHQVGAVQNPQQQAVISGAS